MKKILTGLFLMFLLMHLSLHAFFLNVTDNATELFPKNLPKGYVMVLLLCFERDLVFTLKVIVYAKGQSSN